MKFLPLFGCGAAVLILVTLVSLRRAHIRVEYSISWLVVGLALLCCSVFPGFTLLLAGFLGLDLQVCLVIIAGVLVSGLLFEVSLVVSGLRDENVLLAQRIAILEYHLRRIQSGDAKAD